MGRERREALGTNCIHGGTLLNLHGGTLPAQDATACDVVARHDLCGAPRGPEPGRIQMLRVPSADHGQVMERREGERDPAGRSLESQALGGMLGPGRAGSVIHAPGAGTPSTWSLTLPGWSAGHVAITRREVPDERHWYVAANPFETFWRTVLGACRPGDVEPLARGERLELGRAEGGGGASVGDEHVGGDGRVGVRGAAAQHRPQRDHPGAAADQLKRTALLARPRGRPIDRSADLELVAGDHLVHELGRDLAVLEALGRQLDGIVLRR